MLTSRMKFFAHPDLDRFKRDELDGWFAKVVVDKPKESRSGMSAHYLALMGAHELMNRIQ